MTLRAPEEKKDDGMKGDDFLLLKICLFRIEIKIINKLLNFDADNFFTVWFFFTKGWDFFKLIISRIFKAMIKLIWKQVQVLVKEDKKGYFRAFYKWLGNYLIVKFMMMMIIMIMMKNH